MVIVTSSLLAQFWKSLSSLYPNSPCFCSEKFGADNSTKSLSVHLISPSGEITYQEGAGEETVEKENIICTDKDSEKGAA